MKPLKLTLRGINSYRKEQTIDFASLTSAGLFGIFGPTGSGKSSILDTVTLALYAKLPRSTKNFINSNEQSAAVSFTFSITTSKTRIYLAERSFRYHKSGGAATVRNTAASLADITENSPVVLADRPTEVTQECIRLLGLTADDFMRTVVLPQGQFSEFLKLKNTDRRNMLQRLFHLEQYGQELTQKIISSRQKQEILLSGLEGQIKTFASVTPEQIEMRRLQKQQLSAEEQEVKKQREKAEISFKEADDIRALLSEYEPAKKAYETCLSQKPLMEEKQRRLEKSKRANLVLPFLRQAQKAKTEYALATEDYHAAQSEFNAFLSQYQHLQEKKGAVSKEYETKLPQMLQKEQHLQTALERSVFIRDWEEKKRRAAASKKANRRQLDFLSSKEQTLSQKETEQKAQLEKWEADADRRKPCLEKTAALEQGHILEETYREKRNHYEQNKKAALELQKQTEEAKKHQRHLLLKLQEIWEQFFQKRQSYQHTLDKLQTQLAAIRQEKIDDSQKLDDLQRRHLALILRETLKDGDVCPVCGSICHRADSSGEFSDAASCFLETDPVSDELSGIQNLKNHIQELERQEREQTDSINKKEKEMDLILLEMQAIESLLSEETAADFLRTDPDKKTADFSAGNTQLHSGSISPVPPENAAKDESCITAEELQKKSRRLTSDYNSFQGQYQQLLSQCQRQADLSSGQYRQLKQALDEILTLRKQWNVENFTEELTAKRQQEKEYEQLQKKMKELQKELEISRQQRRQLSEDILQVSSLLSSADNEILQYTSLISEETKKFPEGYSPDLDFSLLLAQAKQEKNDLEAKKTSLEEAFQKAEQHLQQKKEQLSSADNKQKLSRQHMEQADLILSEQRKHAGFAPETDLDSLSLSEETMEELEKTLQDFQETLTKSKDRLHYLEDKRQNRYVTSEEWTARKERLETLNQQLGELQKQGAVLIREIETFQRQMEKKLELEQEYQGALHRRSIIRQLEQLFKGNSFVEYVAESRLQYIACEASSILSSISNGNYELEVNASSEFIIRDNKNGGILRPCDTLSGGETFITSLSLALALSSVVQLNGAAPLELFFLDEGFGSLDDELLDVVMTSLERLQSGKRSIGIITHVEAIQARVPVKLVVTPSDISQNGSVIHLEYS